MKIADQLYIVFKKQFTYLPGGKASDRVEGAPLAFQNAYEPNKRGWEKKNKTQLDWAYGPHWEIQDHKVWHIVKSYKMIDGQHQHQLVEVERSIVPEHLQPRIIENEAVSGFKLVRSVSRYSTSNKLWRILDPRGFELEISTDNMETILMGSGVIGGAIYGAHRWHGKQLVSVPRTFI